MKTLPIILCTVLGMWNFVPNQASAQPRIETLTPSSSKLRSTICLQGTNFNTVAANNLVMFGGVRGTVTAASSSNLLVTVPPGVSFGPISVNVNGLSAWSRNFFSSALPTSGTLDATAFGPYSQTSVGGVPQWVAAGDLDGDGRVDLVTIY
jgi:hypothetical protein